MTLDQGSENLKNIELQLKSRRCLIDTLGKTGVSPRVLEQAQEELSQLQNKYKHLTGSYYSNAS